MSDTVQRQTLHTCIYDSQKQGSISYNQKECSSGEKEIEVRHRGLYCSSARESSVTSRQSREASTILLTPLMRSAQSDSLAVRNV